MVQSILKIMTTIKLLERLTFWLKMQEKAIEQSKRSPYKKTSPFYDTEMENKKHQARYSLLSVYCWGRRIELMKDQHNLATNLVQESC